MKKIGLIFGLLIASISNAFANPACVVCTVAVGASLEIARKMGLSDNIVGLWAGALFALLGYWLIIWFDKKNWKFSGYKVVLMLISLSTIGFMYLGELTYAPLPLCIAKNCINFDHFLFSSLLGAGALIGASEFYQWMKSKNGGHAHFPFEKVAIPVGVLLLISVYLYYYGL